MSGFCVFCLHAAPTGSATSSLVSILLISPFVPMIFFCSVQTGFLSFCYPTTKTLNLKLLLNIFHVTLSPSSSSSSPSSSPEAQIREKTLCSHRHTHTYAHTQSSIVLAETGLFWSLLLLVCLVLMIARHPQTLCNPVGRVAPVRRWKVLCCQTGCLFKLSQLLLSMIVFGCHGLVSCPPLCFPAPACDLSLLCTHAPVTLLILSIFFCHTRSPKISFCTFPFFSSSELKT